MPPDTIYMWNLKYDTKELISQNRNRHRIGLWLRRGMEVGEGWMGIWSLQMQTIIHRTDKQQGPPVQHSYIQCPMVNHNGKEYVYVQLTHCYIAEINNIVNQLFFNLKKHEGSIFHEWGQADPWSLYRRGSDTM